MNKEIMKPWGFEEIIEQNDFYVVKRIIMLKNKRCSLQYHKQKVETIYVISGQILLTIDNHLEVLNTNDTMTILNNVPHRMKGLKDSVYLEVSTNYLNDVVRIEDDYGRIC